MTHTGRNNNSARQNIFLRANSLQQIYTCCLHVTKSRPKRTDDYHAERRVAVALDARGSPVRARPRATRDPNGDDGRARRSRARRAGAVALRRRRLARCVLEQFVSRARARCPTSRKTFHPRTFRARDATPARARSLLARARVPPRVARRRRVAVFSNPTPILASRRAANLTPAPPRRARHRLSGGKGVFKSAAARALRHERRLMSTGEVTRCASRLALRPRARVRTSRGKGSRSRAGSEGARSGRSARARPRRRAAPSRECVSLRARFPLAPSLP